MASRTGDDRRSLTRGELERLERIRATDSLAALVPLSDATDGHEAYLDVKPEWRDLRARELGPVTPGDGLPGTTVTVEDRKFHVHGVTHAATKAEGEFLREHVDRFLVAGHDVYCEQGIRAMYFDDYPDVCQIDDYRWAMARCRELDVESHVSDLVESLDRVGERVNDLTSRFRSVTYALVDAGSEFYGAEYGRTIGDVAASFLMQHEDLATGNDFASFALSERAAENPQGLAALQHYYETAFLPQPLEREWLCRHDPELEIVTHARNEYMADYAVAHHDGSPVHVITGAAHQPGIRFYLERHRDGYRSAADYDPVV